MFAPGTTIVVTGWPRTKGKRFVVKAVEDYDGPSHKGTAEPTVLAYELEGTARGKLRAFPASVCAVARNKKNARQVRGQDPPLVGTATRDAKKAAELRAAAGETQEGVA